MCVYRYGLLGSIDSNTGSPDLGWDTDQFPMDIKDCALVMKVQNIIMACCKKYSIPVYPILQSIFINSPYISPAHFPFGIHLCIKRMNEKTFGQHIDKHFYQIIIWSWLIVYVMLILGSN